MNSILRDLEMRVAAIEASQQSITELVTLLEDVQGALRMFIRVGKGVKWLASILLAFSGIAWVIKHFGSAP